MFYEKKSAGVLVLTVIAVLLASCSGDDTSVETAEATRRARKDDRGSDNDDRGTLHDDHDDRHC